ncbi:glycine--tRNA ligase subunit beta [Enterobacteriaceae endosymbiont of Macroplea appendiculata]|uniref:glycine--tRNA ligase subunit beta n=1 Tax=Enterobacteriaceae endosymbiont of Macroplea appendiculata TaxID=2675790 RepID=UPI001449565A|nr:glycine--tRNA ligase subunit beta [Enterobacteriaceae endosymbiont of Macroplea appendiculata]QJC30681.1 glycine--tRNA ligase subunit beta [Enterobacteriaceae endosymbiont of Macroplea appendiculata]
MYKTTTLLIEISIEDIPSYILLKLTNIIVKNLKHEIHDVHHFQYKKINFFMTHRRIAIQILSLNPIQNNYFLKIKGPYIITHQKNIFDLTIVKLWMHKHQIKSLKNITYHNNYIFYEKHIIGSHIKDLLSKCLINVLTKIAIPHSMYWHNTFKFIRPIRNICILLDKEFIPINILDIPANNIIYGHRFLYNKNINLLHAKDYEDKLYSIGHIIVNFTKRKNKILNDIQYYAQKNHGVVKLSLDFLNMLTAMVECPRVLVGKIHKRFLKLPKEILVYVMEKYQRYVPIYNNKNQLLPYFLFIININNTNNIIIQEHERVLHARFKDVNFFFEQDTKIKLVQYLIYLKNIIFHNQLGTLFDKTIRIKKISTYLSYDLQCNTIHCIKASLLSKCDLATQMVNEFTDLQGIIGMYYAKHNQEHPAIIQALYDQYQYSMYSQIPSDDISCILFISDKIDTLVGMFSVMLLPTSNKDPYALKKIALIIIRIIIQKKFNLNLYKLIDFVITLYPSQCNKNKLILTLTTFMFQRCKNWYLSLKFKPEIVTTILNSNFQKPLLMDHIIRAVSKFFTLEKKQSKLLILTHKRINKVIIQYKSFICDDINHQLILLKEELILTNHIKKLSKIIHVKIKHYEYYNILLILSELYYPISSFFQNVMINHQNTQLKKNRITILYQIQQYLSKVIDLTKLY